MRVQTSALYVGDLYRVSAALTPEKDASVRAPHEAGRTISYWTTMVYRK